MLRLFFGNEAPEKNLDTYNLDIIHLEAHIRRTTRKINKEGGWDIFGWYKYREKLMLQWKI